ncbi:MAG: hypothetical protein ACTSSG_11270 [Candidatus Heimdallarchaeaceae archaeon]
MSKYKIQEVLKPNITIVSPIRLYGKSLYALIPKNIAEAYGIDDGYKIEIKLSKILRPKTFKELEKETEQ